MADYNSKYTGIQIDSAVEKCNTIPTATKITDSVTKSEATPTSTRINSSVSYTENAPTVGELYSVVDFKNNCPTPQRISLSVEKSESMPDAIIINEAIERVNNLPAQQSMEIVGYLYAFEINVSGEESEGSIWDGYSYFTVFSRQYSSYLTEGVITTSYSDFYDGLIEIGAPLKTSASISVSSVEIGSGIIMNYGSYVDICCNNNIVNANFTRVNVLIQPIYAPAG